MDRTMAVIADTTGPGAPRLDGDWLLELSGAVSPLTNASRLLELRMDALPDDTLVAERVVMREALNQPFELRLDAVSLTRHLPLTPLLGEAVSVWRRLPDGRQAPWHGQVDEALQLGADGGLARYQLVIRPWLAWLARRHDTRVFQDKTARQVVDEVLRPYAGAHHEWRVSEPLRARPLCMQHRQSDLAFVHRLLAEEGLCYHFVHLEGEEAARAREAGQACHRMVITDRFAERDDLGPLRFTGHAPTALLPDQRDALIAFAARRTLAPTAVTVGSWDPAALSGISAQSATQLDRGHVPTLEHYDGSGIERFEDAAHAQRTADIWLASLEWPGRLFDGRGTARHLRPGAEFQLVDHALYGPALSPRHARPEDRFAVVAVEHEASNTLGGQMGRGIAALGSVGGGHERGSYRCRFTCVPASATLAPAHPHAPTAPGMLAAQVVGVQGEPVTTERNLRVKVQFPWQRGAAPLPGGLVVTEGHAPGNEQAGIWLRVAVPTAGAHWGSAFVPRAGTLVAVQFVEGDIDRPIIVGPLYSQAHVPPYAAGEGSGINHPGTLSGVRSQALDEAGHNEWVIDDTTGQLRMRLSCSHAEAQLGMGHLIHQAPGTAQRGEWRGAGFEALTHGWACLRAGSGMVLSTTARPGSEGSATSTQMDAEAALSQLRGAAGLAQRLSAAVAPTHAHPPVAHRADAPLGALITAIDPQAEGAHPHPLGGQPPLESGDDGRTPAHPVARMGAPYLLLDSPCAAAVATAASITAYAGQASAIVAQGDLHQAAAGAWAGIAGQTTSLFTQTGGLMATAAQGPVSLRAHTDSLTLQADQQVRVLSVNDEVRVQAATRIELTGGACRLLLDGADITFSCPGQFSVQGGAHAFEAGGEQPASLQALPQGAASEAPTFMELNLHDEWLAPIPGAPFRVVFSDGTVKEGVLDEHGHARLEGVPPGTAQVYYGEDPRPPEARTQLPANTLRAGSATNEQAIANLQRYMEDCDRFWAEQATAEQRELHDQMGTVPAEPEGENAWDFLDAAQQQALRAQLEQGAA